MFVLVVILRFFFNCRVLKQTIRSSGANITVQRIEDISLCDLFLMDAAKRADELVGIHKPPQGTQREMLKDISIGCALTSLITMSANRRTFQRRTVPILMIQRP